MPYELIKTPLSESIATEIKKQMREKRIKPIQLERMLADKIGTYSIRRIRKGHSGCTLRTYEELLNALDLQLCVISKHHPDLID